MAAVTPPSLRDLTVEEFAAAAGVTERTIRRWLAAGKLPYEKRRDGAQPRIFIQAIHLEPFKRGEAITEASAP